MAETGDLNVFTFEDLRRCEEAAAERDEMVGPASPEHRSMCAVVDGHVCVWWRGGAEYAIDLDRIESRSDLLWWVLHLSAKGWRHTTAKRIAAFIRSVCEEKGWSEFYLGDDRRERRPENLAPVPREHVLAERARVTQSVRWGVLKRDGWRCRACGFSVQDGAHLHVDHVVPVSAGGTSDDANLQTLCSACNIGKGAS